MRIVFAILLGFFTGLPQLTLGQRQFFDRWYEGMVALESGDTLRGRLKYNLENDLIQITDGNTVETFTPRKVFSFEIYDESANQYRQFFSIPHNTSQGYSTPVFFELLSEGSLTVLGRESYEYRTFNSSFYNYGTNTRLVQVNEYYLLREDGSIDQFYGNRKDWLNLMGKWDNEVARYAKNNRLSFDNKFELMKIINHFNSLAAE